MKLWKGATFAFMLCGAALSIILVRNMATIRQFKPKTKCLYTSRPSSRDSTSKTSTASSSPSTESTISRSTDGPHRKTRSADSMNTILSEFSLMFQSFTEGELQRVMGTLLDRKRRKDWRVPDSQTRRTKRAQRPRSCTVRELELTVSELGLGYESDETVLLRYCSGKCKTHRQNYDITMEHMMLTGFKRKGRKDKVSNGPCCRPIAFEKDFSFLDNRNRYHTIQNVSAKNCGCV